MLLRLVYRSQPAAPELDCARVAGGASFWPGGVAELALERELAASLPSSRRLTSAERVRDRALFRRPTRSAAAWNACSTRLGQGGQAKVSLDKAAFGLLHLALPLLCPERVPALSVGEHTTWNWWLETGWSWPRLAPVVQWCVAAPFLESS